MIRIAAVLALSAVATTLLSCSGPTKPEAAAPTAAYRLRRLPPEPKEIVSALLAFSQTPLTVSDTCAGVGSDPSDTTIGQFIASFLAELNDTEARNLITTSSKEEALPSGAKVWVCRVMIRHAKGDDVWSWGVEFSVGAQDRVVLPESLRCLGAG